MQIKEPANQLRFQGLFCSRSLLREGQGLWVGRSKMAATPARRQEEERPWGRRCPQTRQCKTCNAKRSSIPAFTPTYSVLLTMKKRYVMLELVWLTAIAGFHCYAIKK